MSKNIMIIGITAFVIGGTALCATAEPIMINDLGGLYLMNNREEYAINTKVEKATSKATQDTTESDIKIKETSEENVTPVSNTQYSFERGTVETSKNYIDTPSSGVNASKTIYTDDLGRLHFFGKGNLIKGEKKEIKQEIEE